MSYPVFARTKPNATPASKPLAKSATRLHLGGPDDAFEREADRVAHEVLTATPGFNWSISNVSPGARVQRSCAGAGHCNCANCAKARTGSGKQSHENESDLADEMPAPASETTFLSGMREISQASKRIQRQEDESASEEGNQEDLGEDDLTGDESGRPKRIAGQPGARGTVPWVRPSGQGEPLSPPVRNFMENRFGYNFATVRIHSGQEASHSASLLQAHAYTVGNDIYFNKGEFQPESRDGAQLLAHELTHVVQQSNGRATERIQRKRGRTGRPAPKPCGPASCDGKCAAHANPQMHSPICGNETCPTSGPSSSSNFIRHLDVNRTTQMVEAEMGDAAHATGLVGPFLSSPNKSDTPPGPHTIGIKCGPCHTNQTGHGMGWFTSFKNRLEFGFHNSQTVASGVQSAGCVRVPCSRAQWIHDNTSSGVTTVCVHTGRGSSWGCQHPRPRLGGSGGGGTGGGTVPSNPPALSQGTEGHAGSTGAGNELA